MSALAVSKQSSYIAAAGRLFMALIFVISGIGKMAAPAMTLGYIASAGLPLPVVGYFLAIGIEIGGGIFLAVGFRTRIVAVAMAAFSAATALIFHHDFADPNQMMHFLKNLAMTGGLLQIVAFGGGVFSIDGFESSLRPASARSLVNRVCSLEEVQS